MIRAEYQRAWDAVIATYPEEEMGPPEPVGRISEYDRELRRARQRRWRNRKALDRAEESLSNIVEGLCARFPGLVDGSGPTQVDREAVASRELSRTERRHYFRGSGVWIVRSAGGAWSIYSRRDKEMERRARDRQGRFKSSKTPQVVPLPRANHYRMKRWHCWLAIARAMDGAGPTELAARLGKHRRTIQRALVRPDVRTLATTIQAHKSGLVFGGEIEIQIHADCRHWSRTGAM
jgi:hypothetical protein